MRLRVASLSVCAALLLFLSGSASASIASGGSSAAAARPHRVQFQAGFAMPPGGQSAVEWPAAVAATAAPHGSGGVHTFGSLVAAGAA
ncbi:hypothetical protein T484DRAFT_1836900 [Baffinella frigidus]|nr:hypothetical protein T484DRAFT_1836900 [Cryptophyta sp. CCMP2293]